MADLINFYSVIDKKYTDNSKYYNPNAHLGLPRHPFRALIIGGSGSGKTNTCLNIIFKGKNFEHIYLFAKTLDEPLYKALIDTYENAGKMTRQNLITYSTDAKDVPNLKDIDDSKQNLFIFDDMITLSKNEHNPINEMFIRGRKSNCSVVYISQSYFGIPKIIRLQANFLVLKKINSTRDFNMIAKDCGDLPVETLKTIYKQATVKKEDCLCIDHETVDEEKKYRKNFGELLNLKDSIK